MSDVWQSKSSPFSSDTTKKTDYMSTIKLKNHTMNCKDKIMHSARTSNTLLMLILTSGAFLSPGCTWISDIRLTEKEQTLDQDGDGVSSFNGDCNDFDATISPENEEIWYDGIDQNCDGMDDYDQDGDGFVPSEYFGLPTAEVPGSGLLPEGDCWDTPTLPEEYSSELTGLDIYPNSPNETIYDGIDQNCDGKSDFDNDGDGFTPDEYAETPTLGLSEDTDPMLPGGDCNDNNASINSDQTEVWYNGVDQNCDGRNDYDQDDDGYVRDEHIGLATEGIEDSDQLPGGDCNEEDPTINPGETDPLYDGIDQNCDGADEYDQDGDGFATNDPLYEGLSTLPSTDCDDTDADIYPGALENLTDTRDLDCDGGTDSFQLDNISWGSFDVLNTNTPAIVEQLAASANDSKLYVAFFQDLSIGLNGSANPLAIGFDFDARTVDTYFNWATINALYGKGMKIIVRDDMFYGGFGEDSAQNRWLHLTARNLDTGTITHRRAFINSAEESFSDVDAFLDADDLLHTMGCVEEDGAIGFQYAMNPSVDFFPTPNNTVTAVLKLETSIPEMRYSKCKFYGYYDPSATFVGVKNEQIDLYDFTLPVDNTPPVFTLDSTLDIQDVQDILVFSQAEELSILYTTSDSIGLYDAEIDQTIKENVVTSSVHAHQFDNKLLIGFVDNNGDAGIIYYDITTQTSHEFRVTTSFTPTEIQPWHIPESNELIIVAIGQQNLAFGHAEYIIP